MSDDAPRVPKVLSASMAGLLRHNEGGILDIDGSGWADVDAVVAAVSSRTNVVRSQLPFDRDVLLSVVAEDDKSRFELDGTGSKIRAASGHSIEVDLGLSPYVPQGPLWFGTVTDKMKAIETDGLLLSAKRKVRLVETREAAEAIAVARGCEGPLVLEIDAPALAAAGYVFGRNAAGEILTDKFGPEFISESAPEAAPSPR